MRLRIRTVARLKNGSIQRSQQTVMVEGRRIRIGRATDNEIELKDLRVAYHHAEITVRDFDLLIESLEQAALSLDDVPIERGVIDTDSVVAVGPYQLRLMPLEAGADLTIEVELVSPARAESVDQVLVPRRVQLTGGLLGRRPMSWLLFLLVLGFSLALPVAAYYTRTPAPPPSAAGRVTVTAAAPGGPLKGIDKIWNSGELSSSHKYLINNCESCHEKAFRLVRPEACGACHAGVQHHFETARFTFAGFEPTGCTGCHGEHQGPDGNNPPQQKLCADCHGDLSARGFQPPSPLLDVRDFDPGPPGAHPEFRVSVVTDPAGPVVTRIALDPQSPPQERSGLIFPHDIHIVPPGLQAACSALAQQLAASTQASDLQREDVRRCKVLQDAQREYGRPELGCGDCHKPEPGGMDMLPVVMETSCGACHKMKFAEGRFLPHGQPAEVVAVVRDYFDARANRAQPLVEAPPPPSNRRRAGDTGGAGAANVATFKPDPAKEAGVRASQQVEDIFSRSLCGECHEVVRPENSPTGQWDVRPVKVADLWMPKARFDHEAHKTADCALCHKAPDSRVSRDVLMPPIATCRECHAGGTAQAALPSPCTMCHVYHVDALPPMLSPAAHGGSANAAAPGPILAETR